MGMLFGGHYSGPREVKYLFIDGHQLNCTLEEVGMDWFGCPIELDYARLRGDHTKVWYYDCLPARKPTETELQHQQRREDKLSFFSELRDLPGWHVSEGLARHRRKERQEQKEVDILIAVDMLTHTHRRNMHRLTFLTGDQDFAPLVEAVVREGMNVELWYPPGHTSQDLKHFADHARPLDVEFLHAHATQDFQNRFAMPMGSYEFDARAEDATPIEEGVLGGVVVAVLWRDPQGVHTASATTPNQQGHYFRLRHREPGLVKRWFARHQDGVEWRPVRRL